MALFAHLGELRMMGAKIGAQKAAGVFRFREFGRAGRVCVYARPTFPSIAQGAPLVA